MFTLDPLGFVAQLIAGYREAKILQQWLRLVGSMVFSAIISYFGVAGLSLRMDESMLLARGAGYLAVAVSVLSLFCASPLTRGMMVSVPQSVVKKMHEGQGQVTISREFEDAPKS
jgi:hypothetical protein